jgi:hypothetical protein
MTVIRPLCQETFYSIGVLYYSNVLVTRCALPESSFGQQAGVQEDSSRDDCRSSLGGAKLDRDSPHKISYHDVKVKNKFESRNLENFFPNFRPDSSAASGWLFFQSGYQFAPQLPGNRWVMLCILDRIARGVPQMFKIKFARILESSAAVCLVLALAACGGGSSTHNFLTVSGPQISSQPVGPEINSGQTATLSVTASGSGTLSYQWYQGPTGTTTSPISGATSPSYTTPALNSTTSYWVQVSDSAGSTNSNTAVVLIAGPRQVQALIFSLTTQPPPATFIANVLQNISGVSIGLRWNEIESSNAAGTGSGGYDFTAFDASLQPYLQAGRKVNLIVWPATEGGNNDPNNGGSTPAYVFSTTWASDPTVKALNPLDMAVCPSYTGDSSNPFFSLTQNPNGSPNGGAWNITTSSDLSGLPVSYEPPFMVAYQNFIMQVILHYNGNKVTPINYIRFGFSQGGENSPECNQYWPGYNKTAYLGYVKAMTDFIHAQSPSMTILADLHAVGPPGSVDYGYADTEASDAETDQFGIGTNGLQASDITNFMKNLPCDSDWCSLFTPAGGFSYSPTLSLQTLQWSDPTGQDSTNPTGPFPPLELFAKDHGANNLELYLVDVGLAFDTANYQTYQHASATINAGTYGSAYAAAIQDFLTH